MFKNILLILLILLYLTGLLFSFPFIYDNLFGPDKLDSIRNFFEYGIMFCSFLVFNAFLFKNKYTFVIAVILCLLLSINFLGIILVSIFNKYIKHLGLLISLITFIISVS